MDIETFYHYCLAKPGVEETFPFDEKTLVFKVMGKMFALTGLEREEFTVNLKCDPEYATELREAHADIRPGFHMSKKHWNTVHFQGELSDRFLCELIDHSYELVVNKLRKADREVLAELAKEDRTD
ncbi:MAG: MmcQ/YjbR family DNA-binding protein [Bacteroidota bacterium]